MGLHHLQMILVIVTEGAHLLVHILHFVTVFSHYSLLVRAQVPVCKPLKQSHHSHTPYVRFMRGAYTVTVHSCHREMFSWVFCMKTQAILAALTAMQCICFYEQSEK